MEKVENNGVDIFKNDEENFVMLNVGDTVVHATVKFLKVPYG